MAGLVKGLGIMSMKNAGIMDSLKAAVEDKKDPAAREVRARGSGLCMAVAGAARANAATERSLKGCSKSGQEVVGVT